MIRQASLLMLLLAAVVAIPAAGDTVLGQTALNASKVDGALVPAGTTLLSPSTLETGADPVAVHLATGQTLNLGPNSSARLAATPEGRITLAARSGAVAVGIETGEVFQLAANTVVMVSDSEPGTGDAVVMVQVCDAGDNLTEWDAANIGNCESCYLPDADGNCTGTAKGKGKGKGSVGLGLGAALGVGGLVGGFLIADHNKSTRIVACGVPDASGSIPAGTNPPGVGGCP